MLVELCILETTIQILWQGVETFFKINFLKDYFGKTISLDPDQDQQQRLSADMQGKSKLFNTLRYVLVWLLSSSFVLLSSFTAYGFVQGLTKLYL